MKPIKITQGFIILIQQKQSQLQKTKNKFKTEVCSQDI